MKKIIVASKNPVKIMASLRGFESMFPGEEFEATGVSVSSDVSEQPASNSETFSGALNRANNAYTQHPGGDFYVGIEGGIEAESSDMMAFAWVVIRSHDDVLGKGKTGTFFLPPKISELIRQGKELGEADDIVFGTTNSKQQNGAVGILAGNVIDRTKYYTDAVVFALTPLKNKKLYSES